MFPLLYMNHGTMEIFHGSLLKRDLMSKIQTVFWWGRVKVSQENMLYQWSMGEFWRILWYIRTTSVMKWKEQKCNSAHYKNLLPFTRNTTSQLIGRGWLHLAHLKGWSHALHQYQFKVWIYFCYSILHCSSVVYVWVLSIICASMYLHFCEHAGSCPIPISRCL